MIENVVIVNVVIVNVVIVNVVIVNVVIVILIFSRTMESESESDQEPIIKSLKKRTATSNTKWPA